MNNILVNNIVNTITSGEPLGDFEDAVMEIVVESLLNDITIIDAAERLGYERDEWTDSIIRTAAEHVLAWKRLKQES